MPVGPAGTTTSRGAMELTRAGAGTTYSAILARTSLSSPVVKTMPTLPTSLSCITIQVLSPLRSQYSRMHLRIMVFLPMRIWEWGRRAWSSEREEKWEDGTRQRGVGAVGGRLAGLQNPKKRAGSAAS